MDPVVFQHQGCNEAACMTLLGEMQISGLEVPLEVDHREFLSPVI